jgi:glycosyltransferase involved in cell wall biosynthesis
VQLDRSMVISRVGFGPKPMSDAASIAVPLPRRYSVGKIVRGFVGPAPISILNYTSSDMFRALARIVSSTPIDIAQIEAVHMLPYVPVVRSSSSNPVVVCDWHCFDSEIMQRFSQRCTNPAKRLYARRTAVLLEQAELQIANMCDLHLAVSDREKRMVEALTSRAPVHVIPNGINCSEYERPSDEAEGMSGRRKLVFVGTMDYQANIEGVLWLAKSVMPALVSKYPNLQLVIVGRNPAPEILRLNSGSIQVVGTVEDVRPYYQGALASVVPLHVGSGTRIKILEAMAAFTPVVSTKLGAEGLSVIPGEHYLAAESVEQWVSSITDLIENPRLWRRLRGQARSVVERTYDWNVIGHNLRNIYAQVIETRHRGMSADTRS